MIDKPKTFVTLKDFNLNVASSTMSFIQSYIPNFGLPPILATAFYMFDLLYKVNPTNVTITSKNKFSDSQFESSGITTTTELYQPQSEQNIKIIIGVCNYINQNTFSIMPLYFPLPLLNNKALFYDPQIIQNGNPIPNDLNLHHSIPITEFNTVNHYTAKVLQFTINGDPFFNLSSLYVNQWFTIISRFMDYFAHADFAIKDHNLQQQFKLISELQDFLVAFISLFRTND